MANLRRINQEDLRNHNLSVTLDTLLRAQKPMSRADLAKETGLTKATLSLLASMLIESGVVQEGEPVVSTTYGRPSTPLEIRGGSIAGIGLQINTDGYGCLALDLNGDTLGREWVSEDMTGTDPYEIFAKLDAMTFPLESRLKRRGCKVVGAGFALPGIVTDDMWLLVAAIWVGKTSTSPGSTWCAGWMWWPAMRRRWPPSLRFRGMPPNVRPS